MERLSVLNNHFQPAEVAKKKGKIWDDVWAGLHLDQYMSEKAINMRNKTRKVMDELEDLTPYYNKAEFPLFPLQLVDKFRHCGFSGMYIKEFGGAGLSTIESGAIAYELTRKDGSIATFILVHNSLGTATIDKLGSEEQRKRMLPDLISLNKLACWALTEPEYGSDASSIKTTAKKVEGGYLLNGTKRWITNAALADYLVIWARNENEGGKIQAFVIEDCLEGLSFEKIENKYSMRMTLNQNIYMKDVFVPDRNRLEKSQDFALSTNQILMHSRLLVAWGACGGAAGAYEACLKYTMKRVQFGKPIAKFQLIQEKLSRMCVMVEMMLTLALQLSHMYDQGKCSIGQIGRAKAYCTKMGREVCALARECLGGNGILLENHVMKAMMDAESSYTYEGTYDINMLVSARELTGSLSAFK